jgi:hypothetical protein
MDPLGASACSGLSSLSTGRKGFGTLNKGLEGGVVVPGLSLAHPLPRQSTSLPALFSGSDMKNASTELFMFVLDEARKFNVADATIPVSWLVVTRGGRGGRSGG